MSNNQTSKGRRSKKTYDRMSKHNYGFGRKLSYAAGRALDQSFGLESHFNTRSTHKRRFKVFEHYCAKRGLRDLRNVDREFMLAFGHYLGTRLGEGYTWRNGEMDEPISVAYAHNVISTVNVVMRALRQDNHLKISAREILGICRQSVRTSPIQSDIADVRNVVAEAMTLGLNRGAAIILLCRAFGMRVREAILQNLDRMHNEIKRTGEAAVLEGCKGGRKADNRTIKAGSFQMEALEFALNVRPEQSVNLLSESETVKSFLVGEVDACRQILKENGVPNFRELRAAFAEDIYEQITGGPSPLKESIRDKVLDRVAREEVARQLGHNRMEVASSYVGGLRNAP